MENFGIIYQDMLGQWSMPINAGWNFRHWSKMYFNKDQFWSILLNTHQCRSALIRIEKYWSILTLIDRHWSLLKYILNQCQKFDPALISIDLWSSISSNLLSGILPTTMKKWLLPHVNLSKLMIYIKLYL